jgi:tetratricopeptide (TPR) repeat protein
MKYLFLGFSLCWFSLSFSQNEEGFWDNSRATNETVILNAGKRKSIKTYDFPAGTTEVVYSISLLDDNQKITSSLVSVLKAIPDPTGISQGSAGAVFLASTISGDDKCKFAVFTNENDAVNYEKNGVAKNACVLQDEPVNKAANLLSEKSKCMLKGSGNLWFVFQSDNWVMKEKIVLEVVPWVNNNLKKGWTAEAKKEILKVAEKLDIVAKISNKDLFYGNFINAFVSKYSYDAYKNLLHVEKTKIFNDLAEDSLIKSGQLQNYLISIREEANKLDSAKKSAEAILLIQKELIDKNRAKAEDYFLIGSLYLSSKQFVKAEDALLKSIEMNKSDVAYQLQLAHLFLFSGKISEAKDIHKKYKLNYFSNGKSWTEQTKIDFKKFEENGFTTDNFKKILRILE